MSKTPKEGSLRIFVVDDHEDVAEGLAEVLRVHGHEVTVAFNGEQAVRIFKEQDFDLAFMDVMMPGMNGVESFLEIRKIKPDAKVIMMTGYSVEQLLDQAIDSGAYGVLHKPVGIGEVLEALERVKSQGMVLVADDDPNFSESIREVLEDEGYRVCMARTGRQALNAVLAGGIDILVLDLRLPVISGLEVYLELQKRGRALPTVVVTGYSRAEAKAIDTLSHLSNTGILTKPFDSRNLLDALGKIAIEQAGPAGLPAGAQKALELLESEMAQPIAPGDEGAAPPAEPKLPAPAAAEKTAAAPPRAPSMKFQLPGRKPKPAPAPEPVLAPAPASAPAPAPKDPTIAAPKTVAAPAPRPPASSIAAAAAGHRNEIYTARRGRILAVDDDEDLVNGLAEVLDTQGYQVQTANDAESAEKLIKTFDAQVALLDIRLGTTNGLDLIPVLKEYRPNIYCVVITGNADRESAITALRNGAYDYMAKPLHPSELFSVVDRCLEKYRLLQDAKAAFDALQIAKDAAESANRARSEFLARMSHELRKPINAMVGSANILIDETWGPIGAPQYQEHAKKIREHSTGLLGIISYAVDMAKADVGKLDLSEDKVDICRVADSAVNLVQDTVKSDAPSIEVEFPESAPLVWGDERQLKQILVNLLSNAVKFTPNDGRVMLTVRWNTDTGGLDIEVGDTGIGMRKEDIPKALEQFGRIENQAFREYKGAGLGLPLVAAMAEMHGGKLELDSDPGKGTIATVSLPAGRVFAAEEQGEAAAG